MDLMQRKIHVKCTRYMAQREHLALSARSHLCVCVKRQEWYIWQQVMVFALNVCIFMNGNGKDRRKIQNAVVMCECTLN